MIVDPEIAMRDAAFTNRARTNTIAIIRRIFIRFFRTDIMTGMSTPFKELDCMRVTYRDTRGKYEALVHQFDVTQRFKRGAISSIPKGRLINTSRRPLCNVIEINIAARNLWIMSIHANNQ